MGLSSTTSLAFHMCQWELRSAKDASLLTFFLRFVGREGLESGISTSSLTSPRRVRWGRLDEAGIVSKMCDERRGFCRSRKVADQWVVRRKSWTPYFNGFCCQHQWSINVLMQTVQKDLGIEMTWDEVGVVEDEGATDSTVGPKRGANLPLFTVLFTFPWDYCVRCSRVQ